MHYVPSLLLSGVNLLDLPVEEFMRYIGRARYVERLEQELMSKAIADAFGSEE